MLKEVEGLSLKELEKVYKVNENALKVRLFRARQRVLKAFGREGRGVFMSASVLEAETITQYGVEVIGRTEEIMEYFYAVSVERRITHPCVAAITESARRQFLTHQKSV